MPNPKTNKKATKKTAKKPSTKRSKSAKTPRQRGDQGQFESITSKVENTTDAAPVLGAESAVETTYFRDPVSGDAPRADGNVMDTPSRVIDTLPVVEPDPVPEGMEYDDLIGDIRPIDPVDAVEEAAEMGVDAVATTPEGEIIAQAVDGEVTITDPSPVKMAEAVASDVATAAESDAEPAEDVGFSEANPCENRNCDICYPAPAPVAPVEEPGLLARLGAWLATLWNYTLPDGTIFGGLYVTRIATWLTAIIAIVVSIVALAN